MRLHLAALLLAGSCLSIPPVAHEFTSGDLHILHPWSRALPPVAPTGAAYLVIENRGERSDRLTAAHTPIAAHAELHEHVHENDVMKMQEIDSVEIAAGGSVEFAPGGHHVMLFGLKEPLAAGGEYPLTLVFEHAGEVEVTVMVQGEGAADEGHPGHGHDHH